MNIKKQYSVRSLGTPTVFSGQKTFYYKDGQWYYGDQQVTITSGGQAVVPDNNPSLYNSANITDFQKNLELLNSRLNAIHKELTYWDLYKLSASVNSPAEFYSVFSSLAIGQSLVINCETFDINGTKYHKGDVIVKIDESSEIKIDSLATGIYYPFSLNAVDGSTYHLTYKYAEGAPQEGSNVDPKQQYELSLPVPAAGSSNVYGYVWRGREDDDDDSFQFNAIPDSTSSDYIKPIIKVFQEDDSNHVIEEIIVPYTVTFAPAEGQNPATFTVSNWKHGPASFVQIK